ncbi:UNVERIFIED_CONTAM: Perakine reductase [Sesamum latifolium]|uniref:Perakine reductase n=1 Tax=Sesamum latifolium TaxID=2727402 RepID=A0AAW2W0A6_9LAMI
MRRRKAGDNEIMIGKALKELPREQVQIASKFGVYMHEGMSQVQVKGSPKYVRKCIEASLTRLDVDYIDLYYQHRADISEPIEETMGELKKLVEEGKIRYIGLSEASTDTIKAPHAVHPITAVQMEHSLWSREIEEDVIPLCRSEMHPRFTGDNPEKNKVLYTRFASLAAKHSCTPPQLALAWLLHQGNNVVPIPGTTKIKNPEANIGSLAVKLTAEDLKEIAAAIPVDHTGGEREYTIFSKYSYRFANTPQKK